MRQKPGLFLWFSVKTTHTTKKNSLPSRSNKVHLCRRDARIGMLDRFICFQDPPHLSSAHETQWVYHKPLGMEKQAPFVGKYRYLTGLHISSVQTWYNKQQQYILRAISRAQLVVSSTVHFPYLVCCAVFSATCCRRGCSLDLSSFSSLSSAFSRSRSICAGGWRGGRRSGGAQKRLKAYLIRRWCVFAGMGITHVSRRKT